MPEKLHDLLNIISGILHFLGNYKVANDLTALSVFCQKNRLYYPDQLLSWSSPTAATLGDELVEIKELDKNGCRVR